MKSTTHIAGTGTIEAVTLLDLQWRVMIECIQYSGHVFCIAIGSDHVTVPVCV